MRAAKTGKKFTRTEREAVLREVARLDAKGLNQFDIASAVGVSQPQVCIYLKEIRQQYKADTITERAEQVSRKLEQYRHVMRESWAAWECSKVEVKPVVGKDGKVKLVELEVNPDPAYLRIVLDCLQAERELLGLDAPKNVQLTREVDVVDWSVMATRLNEATNPVD